MAKRSNEELEEGARKAPEKSPETDFAKLVLQLTPAEKFGEALNEAAEAIAEHVAGSHPGANVKTIGSAVRGTHLDGSDLDLCVDLPDLKDEVMDPDSEGLESEETRDNTSQVNALKQIMAGLPGSLKVIETRLFKQMKVPIVTLSFKSSLDIQVDADLSIGTVIEGVEKGFTDRLVRRVLARFPKGLHMARVVKLWAKAERLNRVYDGFLNDLGWTLLVIFFFMEKSEVLPGLLDVEEPNEGGAAGGGPPPLLENGAGNDEVPTVEEVAKFFEWVVSMWSKWPREGMWAISVVDGEKIKIEPPKKRWNDTCDLYIEDPGVRIAKGGCENVARYLKAVHWTAIIRQCAVTATALRSEEPGAASKWVGVLKAKAATKEVPPTLPNGTPQMVAPPMAGVAPPDPAAIAWANAPPWIRPWEEAGGAQGPPPTKKSKTPCRWFKLGECWSGDRCKNSHDL